MPNHELFLPWPSKTLSPNARVHWAPLAAAKKKAKNEAYVLAKNSGLGKIDAERVAVTLTFYPPNRRAFDVDGLLARHKAALDGLSMAIGVDDSKFQITPRMAGTIEKRGLVKIELEW